MKKITLLFSVWAMLFPFTGSFAQETEPEYCSLTYNGSSGSITGGNGRSFSSIELSDQAGHSTTINVNASGSRNIYYDFLSTSFETKPGQTIRFNSTGSGEWMQTYVYIDWNYNGFDMDDQVYNNYVNNNTNNVYSQDFTVKVPDNQAPGNYRCRYMITWDDDGPCNIGQSGKDNGDVCVDFVITIPEPTPVVVLTAAAGTGSLTLNVATVEASTVYVDWGDGNKTGVEVTDSLSTFNKSGSKLAITTPTAITGTPVGEVKIYADNLLCFLAPKQPVETIQFSDASHLVWLDLSETSISKLDAGNLSGLETLKVNDTRMSAVDVTASPGLLQLFAGNLGLTKLNVTNNPKLSTLSLANNQLTTLDVSPCSGLNSLIINYNQFSKASDINFPQGAQAPLTRVQLTNNNFKMSTLPVLSETPYKAMSYAPQADYQLPSKVPVGFEVDLSSEATVQDVATVFTWKTAAGKNLLESTHYNVVRPGVFTFTDAVTDSIFCEMTNTALADFKTTKVYKTTPFTVGCPEMAAVFTANSAVTLNIATAEASTVYVDWGNGEKISYMVTDSLTTFPTSDKAIKTPTEITGTPVGKVKIYADNLLCFLASKQPVDTIEFSAASRLVWLDLANTSISKLDTKSLTSLKALKVNDTQMTAVDVTTLTKLQQLFAGNLGLTEIDVTRNPDLSTLNIPNNSLKSIDISKCDTLANIVINYNLFEKAEDIKFPQNAKTALTRIQLTNNNFKMSTLPVLSEIPYKAMTYAPQADYQLPAEIAAGAEVDLSSEATVQDVATVFTWKTSTGTPLLPDTHYIDLGGGRFTFTPEVKGSTVLCEMTNTALADFKTTKVYKTTQFTVGEALGIEEAQAASAVYAVAGDGTVRVKNLEPGCDVALYNMSGALVATQKAAADVLEFAVVPGLYIVRAGTFRQIVAVQ